MSTASDIRKLPITAGVLAGALKLPLKYFLLVIFFTILFTNSVFLHTSDGLVQLGSAFNFDEGRTRCATVHAPYIKREVNYLYYFM